MRLKCIHNCNLKSNLKINNKKSEMIISFNSRFTMIKIDKEKEAIALEYEDNTIPSMLNSTILGVIFTVKPFHAMTTHCAHGQ